MYHLTEWIKICGTHIALSDKFRRKNKNKSSYTKHCNLNKTFNFFHSSRCCIKLKNYVAVKSYCWKNQHRKYVGATSTFCNTINCFPTTFLPIRKLILTRLSAFAQNSYDSRSSSHTNASTRRQNMQNDHVFDFLIRVVVMFTTF